MEIGIFRKVKKYIFESVTKITPKRKGFLYNYVSYQINNVKHIGDTT